MPRIGLALQGGGAYAAFTAGALKAMFSAERGLLRPAAIRSISGTSGGALNALLLGLGIHEQQANPTQYVERLWEINKIENLLKDTFGLPKAVPDELLSFFIGMGRSFNESNPVVAQLLREYSKNNSVLNELIDSIVHQAAPTLARDLDAVLFPDLMPYITVVGTEVKSAQANYFTNHTRMIERFRRLNVSKKFNLLRELTLRGVYASLAHPYFFSSVSMGKDVYWDGYYTSNPPFFYLFREGCDEIFLIRLIQRDREAIGEDMVSVHDRAEEIIQNHTLTMEIQMYYLMRELLMENRKRRKGLRFKLRQTPFTRNAVYHEIRLMKPGNIGDEGYPLADFVDKLLRMGEKAVLDPSGFLATYKKSGGGEWQVFTEITYDNENVTSHVLHADNFITEGKDIKRRWGGLRNFLWGRR